MKLNLRNLILIGALVVLMVPSGLVHAVTRAAEPQNEEFSSAEEEAVIRAMMDEESPAETISDVTETGLLKAFKDLDQGKLNEAAKMLDKYPDLSNTANSLPDDASSQEIYDAVLHDYKTHEIDRMTSADPRLQNLVNDQSARDIDALYETVNTEAQVNNTIDKLYGGDPELQQMIEKYPQLREAVRSVTTDESFSPDDFDYLAEVVRENYNEFEAQAELNAIIEKHPGLVDELDNTLSPEANRDKLKALASDLENADRRDTLLPGTTRNLSECKNIMNQVAMLSSAAKNSLFQDGSDSLLSADESGLSMSFTGKDVLACGIKTGRIGLWMFPYYLKYILEFLITMSGLISVGGFIYGGFLYLFSGFSDDKDSAKRALIYSAIGLVITMLAWAMVQIVIAVVTA